MTLFKYKSLDIKQPSFRLIRLFGGQSPVIECEIFHSFLDTDRRGVPYEALSYTWGCNERTETITVNGEKLPITINLHLALSYLRHPQRDRILWVDAICIDQGNGQERNHQVRQMTSIFRNADNVLYWMGTATYATNVAIDSLKQLENECATAACRSWKKTDPRWRVMWSKAQSKASRRYPDLITRQRQGLTDLLERPWFERVWIIQEVASSKRAQVCCGSRSVSARIFALAPHLFAVKPSAQAQSILDIMPGPSRNDSWWGQKHDLYTLLCKFRLSKAGDQRDMIYALRGIASDPQLEEVLTPNYESSEREVIKEVIQYLCHLDIDNLSDTADGYWNAMIDDQSMDGFFKTVNSLYAAAMDQHLRVSHGDDTENFIISSGGQIRITNQMLNLAAKQSATPQGSAWTCPIKLLIETHADESMLENAAMTWQHPHWIKFLLEKIPDSVKVTERVMEAATKNPMAGSVIELLIAHYGNELPLTERVLCAAAGSMYARDVFQALLKWKGDDMPLTYRALWVLRRNESPQRDHTLVLLMNCVIRPSLERKADEGYMMLDDDNLSGDNDMI